MKKITEDIRILKAFLALSPKNKSVLAELFQIKQNSISKWIHLGRLPKLRRNYILHFLTTGGDHGDTGAGQKGDHRTK